MDPINLPFDQYQRYRLTAELVEGLRGDRGPLDVLDVGGRTGILRQFLPEDRIVLVDMEPNDQSELVLGDGSALPFHTSRFDVVAAFDTLEHVPPPRRQDFVRECARVSRNWVFLAGPYQSPEVDEAEELLRLFLTQKLGITHRYLEEHRSYGLPIRSEVERCLRDLGARVQSTGHGNIERWLALMCMEMYMDADPLLRPIAERFYRFYNQALFTSDHVAPVYRHLVCAAFGDAPLPQLGHVLSNPIAPEGTTSAITALGVELFAFDREQDIWRPEIARLEGIIHDLEADLSHHRRSIEDYKTELGRLEQAHSETLVHLGQAEDTADRIQAELVASNQDVSRLAEEIRQYDAKLTELRRQLRSRLGNLRRAIALKKPTF